MASNPSPLIYQPEVADMKSSVDKNSPDNIDVRSAHHVEHSTDKLSGFDNSIENTAPSKAVWLITFTVAMGGFLFGYDTGYISAVLVIIGEDLGHQLSTSEQELITSLTSGGALLGAIIAGLSADKYGRKRGIYVGCALFLAGSVIQASSYGVPQMAVGRFFVGLGVGIAAMIIPLYLSEIAPANYRGRMVALNNASITLGQLTSYGLGAGFTDVSHGWRLLVAVGGVPPIVLAFLLPFCPESPRQLLSHNKADEAILVIRRVYPNATEEQIAAKTEHILSSIQAQSQMMADKTLWWQFKQLHMVPSNLRALISCCAVMAISQLGGFNTLMYYSGTLFGLVGFDKPTLVSIVVGGTNFIFTLVNMAFIDKLGRRLILLITVLGMSLSMVVTAVAFSYIPVSPDLELEVREIGWPGILVLAMIIVYIASFASGCATIAWVGVELLPMEVRALGTMMNTVTCWGCNLIIASTFLSMMKGMTPSGAFGFYAGICFFGWIFIIFCYPEAKNLPLEDVRQIFSHGFGVKKAAELQKEAKLIQKQGLTRV